MRDFQLALEYCDLSDLGYRGPKFTWINCREDQAFIKECLDRGFANPSWREFFPETEIYVEAVTTSDHAVLIASLYGQRVGFSKGKRFRFEASWAVGKDYQEVCEHAWNRTLVQALCTVSYSRSRRIIYCINYKNYNREISLEYCKRTRELSKELLKGISMSLGLGDTYIENALNLESGLQILIANLYPPCPEPELAMGLPPHSDHGLLTLLIQNGISGLQVQHQSKWVNVNYIPNAFIVNVGDHMEIMSNGKYKSVVHRVFVNEKATRISIVTPFGPSLETVVSPAPELVHRETNAPAYTGMKYKDYLHLQQSSQLDGKACLDHVRILPA
ncbi:2-oxoglutarate-dependent dioxygenase 19-like [Corylus avellana]|uniref:2-oxoglutarate-dependent dioxygenase 19-like n=1 Tax=Corylus avellana TaxID=13451 RepID=UPI00286B1252|nr:2-oxoglutarate-dependent dioxygenase 19-like [Corylus avellana]